MPIIIICMIGAGASAAEAVDEGAAEAIDSVSVTVDSVSVTIEYKEQAPPDNVRTRNLNSAVKACEQAFVGKTTEDVEARIEYYKVLVRQVLEDVLRGYLVGEINFEIDARTRVLITLATRGEVIRGVDVEIPEWVLPWFDDEDAERLQAKIDTIAPLLVGLPVSADWAVDGVVDAIRELRLDEDFFIGCKVEPRIQLADRALVSLKLEPQSEKIPGIVIKVRSVSLPNLVLEESKFLVSTRLGSLLGVPKEFVKRHKKKILQVIESAAKSARISKHVPLEAVVILDLRHNMVVNLMIDSPEWSIRIEGFIDVGRNASEESELRGHLGRMFSTGTEIFTNVHFFPGPLSFRTDVGLGQRFGRWFYVAGGREVMDGINKLWVRWNLSPDTVLVWEEKLDRHIHEGGVRFQFHEFFSFSFLSDFRSDYYLRCLVNL